MTTDRAGPEGTIGRTTACLCPIRREGSVFKCGEPNCADIWAHYRKAQDHLATLNALDKRRRLAILRAKPVGCLNPAPDSPPR
jgi:hypothetical protein